MDMSNYLDIITKWSNFFNSIEEKINIPICPDMFSTPVLIHLFLHTRFMDAGWRIYCHILKTL